MLRAVLAILVVAALLAVSQPVVSGGRQEHAATLLADEVDDLVGDARDLVRTDEAVDGPGARRIVALELPRSGRLVAGTRYVEITGGEAPIVEWAVDGGTAHRRVFENLRVRTPDGDPIRIEGEGTRRLVLGLTGPAGDPIVAISRFEPSDGDRNG